MPPFPGDLRKFSPQRTVVFLFLLVCVPTLFAAKKAASPGELWSLRPLEKPPVKSDQNPIDAILADEYKNGVVPLGRTDKLTWLRRVTFDLAGLPPSIEEQDAFLADESPQSFEKVVDRLLASDQYGVRYGRHWLDVLRYADLDENMPGASGIHLWRDWVINALNNDLPYDEFVRAQICGNRARARTKLNAIGHRVSVDPRAEDLFALGFLSRGAASRSNNDQQLAISAVETISTAFLGMTVGCAKCHDHFYDPIQQNDFYSMKALFDPLVLAPVELATSAERFAHGRAMDEYERKREAIEKPMHQLTAPYRAKIYEERLSMLPPDVQKIIRKAEKDRTAPEQKIADDYFPILRLDPPKIREVMPAEEAKQYDAYLKQLNALKAPESLPVFYSVAEDPKRSTEKSYVLTTGDPTRPKLDREVQPGFPFAPAKLEFREGRRETFVDWLTAPENPLFARVAVNRIWQWHFGEGLHSSSSDFGALGGKPLHPRLLDWLAAEFIAHDFSMKWLHRLMVTSETYRRASSGVTEQTGNNQKLDPDNRSYWRFPVQRLDAEPIRDAMLFVAGDLDLGVGGKSFEAKNNRRTAYMSRGYRSSAEAMPDFLSSFDAEDGRAVCTRRTQTVTAPQALFMMNSELADDAAERFGKRLAEMEGDPVVNAYRTALGRMPQESERARIREYLGPDPRNTKGLAWMLINLDEFIFIR